MAVTTNFILRTDRKNKAGESPILLTVYVSNVMRRLSTGINVLPVLWNDEVKEVRYLSRKAAKKVLPDVDYDSLPLADDVKRLNGDLEAMERRINDIATRFDIDHVSYDVDMIVEEFKAGKTGGARKAPKKLYFTDYLESRIPLLTAKRSKGTLQVYHSTLRHFSDFETYSKRRYLVKEIDYSAFEALDSYLIEKGMQNSTIHKVIKTIKTFLNHAKETGLDTSTNYHKYNIELKRTEPVTISAEELNILFNMELSPMLDKVRDVFIFACATGLRLSDVRQLKREHIKGDVIELTAEKTDELISIPINFYSSAILNKYRLQISPIPKLSEQHLNTEIKNLCKLAGIDIPTEQHSYRGAVRETKVVPKNQAISMHSARRTFVSLALANGLDAETVRRWTGHRDLRAFGVYINIEKQRLKTEMAKAFGAPKVEGL